MSRMKGCLDHAKLVRTIFGRRTGTQLNYGKRILGIFGTPAAKKRKHT